MSKPVILTIKSTTDVIVKLNVATIGTVRDASRGNLQLDLTTGKILNVTQEEYYEQIAPYIEQPTRK